MRRNLHLEAASTAGAADLLAGIARQLEAGVLDVDGSRVPVVGPVNVSIELDASRTSARVAVTVRCHRPGGESRLLQEELARPGG